MLKELLNDSKEFADELKATGYFGDDAYDYIGVYSAAKEGEQIDFLKGNEDKIADLPMPVYMWAANDDGSQSFYYTAHGARECVNIGSCRGQLLRELKDNSVILYGEE